MAVYREAPICPKCKEPYKGLYRDESKLPVQMRLIGDTFIRWDIEGHVCKPKKDEKETNS